MDEFTRTNLDSSSWIDKGILPPVLSAENFDDIWNMHPSEHGQVMIYGKIMNTPRWQKSYGFDYSFSGMNHEADAIPYNMQPFMDWANSLGYPGSFNQMLINWYQDGSHYIGSHSDDETQLIRNSCIISVSLGTERLFRIRDKKFKSVVENISLTHGDVVVMGGKMQKRYKHEIVKVSGKKGKSVGRRINLTFRQFRV